jgi:outer membrane protein TolC
MVAVTFDVWDGGRTRANVARAKAVLDSLEEQDRKTILAVASDVEIAWLQLQEARARLDVATQAVAAAEETLELVKAQYDAGSVTVTRYLETESAQAGARTREIRAALDLNRAVVNAKRATGDLGKEAGR